MHINQSLPTYNMSRLDAIEENSFKLISQQAFCENECEDAQDIRLPFLQSSLFATILEDTTIEMRILVECNNEMRITKIMSDMALLLSLKYSIAEPKVKDELDDVDPKKLDCNEYKLNKLDKDRKLVISTFVSAYKDLIKYRNYRKLQATVDNFVNINRYIIEIFEEEAKNKTIRRELNKQLRQQRNHVKSVMYDTDATIEELRSKSEDATLNAEIRSRYVGQWQISRSEQLYQTILDKESIPSGIIEYFKQRADSEQRVHSEIEVLINIAINETLDKVDKWMTKYDKDMEGIDLKIQVKKNEYQNTLDKRIYLENTKENHDILIKEWILFKEEREKLRQYREKMFNSAIVVQAWWRGILVRRQLGPYKVSKKKAAKKK